MDVVATERIIEQENGDVHNGAQISELSSLQWLALHDGISNYVLGHATAKYHNHSDEEEEGWILWGSIVCISKVGIVCDQVLQTKALHNQSIGNQIELCTNKLISLKLV